MKIELMDAEKVILEEIEEKRSTRDSIAFTYAFCIETINRFEFGKINRAIIARWSKSALAYIKKEAWKLVEEKWKNKE